MGILGSDGQRRRCEIDRRVEAVAARQHGVVNRGQALAEGMSRRRIERHVASGRWLAPRRGVYIGAAAPDCSAQRAAVAVLAGPQGTVASHLTAAPLHGLVGFPALPQLTVPHGRSPRSGGAKVRRGTLGPADVGEVGGLPSTTAARTLVDCAGVVGSERLERLVDTALFLRLTTADEVRAAAERVSRAPGRLGIPRLLSALEVWATGAHPDSVPEMTLFRKLHSWGLPEPVRQLPVFDGSGRFVARVDIACPQTKLIFEYDGGEFHGPRRRPLDAARQRHLEALGWTVVRVTKADLRGGATKLRRRLSTLLGRPL